MGHPVFVSISIRDDAELRAWAERQALVALIKGRDGVGSPPSVGLTDVTDSAASGTTAQRVGSQEAMPRTPRVALMLIVYPDRWIGRREFFLLLTF